MMIATVNAPGVALGVELETGDADGSGGDEGCSVATGEPGEAGGGPAIRAGLRGSLYIWPKSAHETNAASKNAIKRKSSLRAIAAGILQSHVGYLNAWR